MRKHRQKFSEQDILDKFRDRHGNKYRYPPFPEKFKVRSIISIICPVHGEFRQTIDHHARGQGCRKCAFEDARLGRDKWIRRFESVHGRGKYDYSKVPDNVRQNTKIEIFCHEHNISFFQTSDQHWRFRQGCPECGKRKQSETRKQQLITRREFEMKARAVHGLLYEYSELPAEFSLNDNIIIYSNEHGRVFFCVAREHLNGKNAEKLTTSV